MAEYKLYQGDNLPKMKAMRPQTVDAIITDTPYGTELAEWDKIPTLEHFVEMYRVAKPGAYMAAFSAPRTHHHMMVAMENAGWEIRDMLMWLYGSGFAPGSANIAENIDKLYGEEGKKVDGVYQPASPEAKEFDGFGVGLKPAWEPIVLARKPGAETIAENLVRYGVGALDIKNAMVYDGQISGATDNETENISEDITEFRSKNNRNRRRIPGQGRWPSNVLLDTESAEYIEGLYPGAARFFFCGKASPSEREAGCEHLGKKDPIDLRGGSDKLKFNNHPTVKPIALMRWVIRLIAPKGSVILDPYMGSGSTGCAAGQERDRLFIGIELVEEFFKIAEARVAHWHSV